MHVQLDVFADAIVYGHDYAVVEGFGSVTGTLTIRPDISKSGHANNDNSRPDWHLRLPRARSEAQIDQYAWQPSHRLLGLQLLVKVLSNLCNSHKHDPPLAQPFTLLRHSIPLCFWHPILLYIKNKINPIEIGSIRA